MPHRSMAEGGLSGTSLYKFCVCLIYVYTFIKHRDHFFSWLCNHACLFGVLNTKQKLPQQKFLLQFVLKHNTNNILYIQLLVSTKHIWGKIKTYPNPDVFFVSTTFLFFATDDWLFSHKLFFKRVGGVNLNFLSTTTTNWTRCTMCFTPYK